MNDSFPLICLEMMAATADKMNAYKAFSLFGADVLRKWDQ
jgi:hypothetical protein